jgi:hypothetical protein
MINQSLAEGGGEGREGVHRRPILIGEENQRSEDTIEKNEEFDTSSRVC